MTSIQLVHEFFEQGSFGHRLLGQYDMVLYFEIRRSVLFSTFQIVSRSQSRVWLEVTGACFDETRAWC
jgi:hypothetical protein